MADLRPRWRRPALTRNLALLSVLCALLGPAACARSIYAPAPAPAAAAAVASAAAPAASAAAPAAGLAPAVKRYDFHVTLATTSLDCFGARQPLCCFRGRMAPVDLSMLKVRAARRAEKQSIVVNGELTPTIEVTRGEVLEVTARHAPPPHLRCPCSRPPGGPAQSAVVSPATHRSYLWRKTYASASTGRKTAPLARGERCGRSVVRERPRANRRGARWPAPPVPLALTRPHAGAGHGAQRAAGDVAAGGRGHHYPLARVRHARRRVLRRRRLPAAVPHHGRRQLHVPLHGAACRPPGAPRRHQVQSHSSFAQLACRWADTACSGMPCCAQTGRRTGACVLA